MTAGGLGRKAWGLVGVLLLAALALFPSGASAYIYFPSLSDIARAQNDGSGLERKFIHTQGVNCGIAVDGQHLYWGELDKGIARANLDGTGVEEEFIPLGPGSYACGVAVDSGHLYWANQNGNKIGIANLDGSEANPAFITGSGAPCGIAAENGQAYFGAFSAAFEILGFTSATGGVTPFAPAAGNCGVALNSQSVFWLNGGPLSTTGHSIQFAARSGGAPATLAELGPAEASAPRWALAVHGEYAYWAPYRGPVGRVKIDSSSPPQPNFLPVGESVEMTGLAVDDLPLPPAPPIPTSPPAAGGGAPSPTVAPSAPPVVPRPKVTVAARVKVDAKNGTAEVTVTVSGPGALKLSGKQVKTAKAKAKHAGPAKLTVRAKGKALGTLARNGHLEVKFQVTFTAAGKPPVSSNGSVKLVQTTG